MDDIITQTPDLDIGDRIGFCAIGDDAERNYTVTYTGTACIGYDDAPGLPPTS